MERDPTKPAPGGDAAGRIAALRAALTAPGPREAPVMSLDLPGIDAALPGKGLLLGAPHEIAPAETGDGPAALGFALALCARQLDRAPGEVLFAATGGQPLPHGHGLAAFLDPGRLLLLEAESDTDVFRALEMALHARCLGAIVGFVSAGLPLKPGRRLQIAGEGPAPPLLLLLRPPGAERPNGAATRWRIASAPSGLDRFGGLAGPRWRVRLERCRNGRPGEWLVEWDRAARRLHLPERLAGDAPAAGRSRA